MGTVCKARRLVDDRIVAIKSMLSRIAVSEISQRVFYREIDVMSQLRHSNLVGFIEKKYASNQFFFVIEFCNGGSLEDLIKKEGGTISIQTAIPILL